MSKESLSDKRKGFVKIPEGELHDKLKDGYYYGKDVREFIKRLKDILTMDGFGHHTDEKLNKIIKRDIIETIDKLAGDDLK